MKIKDFDALVKGVGAIAKIEAQKAVAPLQEKIQALEVENMALKHAIRDLREKQTLADMTPAAVKARYESLQ